MNTHTRENTLEGEMVKILITLFNTLRTICTRTGVWKKVVEALLKKCNIAIGAGMSLEQKSGAVLKVLKNMSLGDMIAVVSSTLVALDLSEIAIEFGSYVYEECEDGIIDAYYSVIGQPKPDDCANKMLPATGPQTGMIPLTNQPMTAAHRVGSARHVAHPNADVIRAWEQKERDIRILVNRFGSLAGVEIIIKALNNVTGEDIQLYRELADGSL